MMLGEESSLVMIQMEADTGDKDVREKTGIRDAEQAESARLETDRIWGRGGCKQVLFVRFFPQSFRMCFPFSNILIPYISMGL